MWYHPPDAAAREQFHQGLSDCAYAFLGAHPVWQNEKLNWHFAVWAPNARQVCVTGEFCQWERQAYPMAKQYDGIWELRLPDALFTITDENRAQFSYPGAAEKLRTYKYAICGADGEWHLKADPYGF